MNMLATSRKRHDPPRADRACAAPPSSRSSLGQNPVPLLLAALLSLLPAALGVALATLLAGQWVWAAGVVLIYPIAGWVLLRQSAWSVRLERLEWAAIVLGSGLTLAWSAPTALPWLLLPVLPAMLLRSACRCGPCPRVRPLIRVFSIASLVAVVMQLAADPPGLGTIVAVTGATLLALTALERLLVPEIVSESGGLANSRRERIR